MTSHEKVDDLSEIQVAVFSHSGEDLKPYSQEELDKVCEENVFDQPVPAEFRYNDRMYDIELELYPLNSPDDTTEKILYECYPWFILALARKAIDSGKWELMPYFVYSNEYNKPQSHELRGTRFIQSITQVILEQNSPARIKGTGHRFSVSTEPLETPINSAE